MLDEIFSPQAIGTMQLDNRLIVPAMVTRYGNPDGTASDRLIGYHEARAAGGWGLIITENYRVDEHGGAYPDLPGLWRDAQIESHRRLTGAVHARGGKIACQLYHAGRQTTSAVTGNQPVAPSPVADPSVGEQPRELTTDEIVSLTKAFGDAAHRAKQAGFDAVEVHGAHGYLINQFMSPFSNKRTDSYGGSPENRARFALEVIGEIRAAVGASYPLIYRLSADELVTGGLTIEDTKVIARRIEAAGIDAVNVSVGVAATARYMIPPASMPHGWAAGFARAIREVIAIPVIAVNRITDPRMAATILRSGMADFIAMGRASLADPALPRKAREGKFDEIRPCIGCLQGCSGNLHRGLPVTCLVNPGCGREREYAVTPADRRKKILVAGGGPAGMEAAIVAASRGHDVHLCEKDDRLGGQWRYASMVPGKEEFGQFTVWQQGELERLGVAVYPATEVDLRLLARERPDAVIIATGSEEIPGDLAGIMGDNVLTTTAVLASRQPVGRRVLVIGGGVAGTQTAAHLAVHHHRVTLVTAWQEPVPDLEPANRASLLEILDDHGVAQLTETAIVEILDDGAVVRSKGGQTTLTGFDTIVVAGRHRPVDDLALEIPSSIREIVTVGDAMKVGNALEAVAGGFQAGLQV
jgi:2,4-dienoyl-CoA reductase-like NADH-dependent reductase (Old Yellow Enzyme family)/thioredoxin reductase